MSAAVRSIFLTGASGYVGGAVLDRIVTGTELRDVRVRCLNRDPAKAAQITRAYPEVEVVQGDLDDTALVSELARSADVVLHLASTKHIASTRAIVAGLTSKTGSWTVTPTWIQMSGATLYAAKEISDGRLGEAPSKSTNDITDVNRIISTIEASSTRLVEKAVISQDPAHLRTALIVGPLIYGKGNGPCHQRSIQAPEIARVTIQAGRGICLLKGENAWSTVHVADLAEMVVLLVLAALADKSVGWNRDGIYHPENGAVVFKDLFGQIATEAVKQGAIDSAKLHEIDAKEADRLSPGMSIFWGTNAVIRSERAGRDLAWRPTAPTLVETIPKLVRDEQSSGQHTK